MSSETTLTRVRLLKHNTICEASQCKYPASYALHFEGSPTPGLTKLALCVLHARETCDRYGYAWH